MIPHSERAKEHGRRCHWVYYNSELCMNRFRGCCSRAWATVSCEMIEPLMSVNLVIDS